MKKRDDLSFTKCQTILALNHQLNNHSKAMKNIYLFDQINEEVVRAFL